MAEWGSASKAPKAVRILDVYASGEKDLWVLYNGQGILGPLLGATESQYCSAELGRRGFL